MRSLIVVCVILVAALVAQSIRVEMLKEDNKAKEVMLTETVSKYKSKYETEVARNHVWEVRYGDIKNIMDQKNDQLTSQERVIKDLVKKVEGMYIPIRNVEYALTGKLSTKIDSTFKWTMDSISSITNRRVRTAQLIRESLTVRVTDMEDSLRLQAYQHLSLYGALYNAKRWKSGKQIKYPRLAFWKEWRIEGAITTSDKYITIDSVYFLNPNR